MFGLYSGKVKLKYKNKLDMASCLFAWDIFVISRL